MPVAPALYGRVHCSRLSHRGDERLARLGARARRAIAGGKLPPVLAPGCLSICVALSPALAAGDRAHCGIGNLAERLSRDKGPPDSACIAQRAPLAAIVRALAQGTESSSGSLRHARYLPRPDPGRRGAIFGARYPRRPGDRELEVRREAAPGRGGAQCGTRGGTGR